MRDIERLSFQAGRHSAFTGAGILVAIGLLIGIVSESAYQAQRIRETAIQAETLAEGVAAALMFDDSSTAAESANALAVNPKVESVAVFNASGNRIAVYIRPQASAPSSMTGARKSSIIRGGAVEATVPVIRDGQSYGAVFIRFGSDPLILTLGRFAPIGLLILMAALVLFVTGAAQRVLSRANSELADRARDLLRSNTLLTEQIEQRQQAEEALLQSRKMEAIGQLTGGVAHDFNNLLMVVSGGLRMIDRYEKGSERWKRTVEAMLQAADRGADLTRQLLAFSRRQPMQPKTFNLESQILGMQELLFRSLNADILLETQFPDGAVWVETDPGLFELAILNLCVNARDAMPRGGTLTLTACVSASNLAEVSVRDTGTGIPPEVLERVFEPYFTTKALGMGTGLGMSQVYGFAKQSGGSVRIQTAVNAGTSVIIELPRAKPPIALEADASFKASQTEEQRQKILVVEDDDQVADTVCNMLEEIGHSVIRVPSAREALTVIDEDASFDLVFSDVIMPGGMSGTELASVLRAKYPALPVLLTTGFSGNEVMDPDRPLLRKPYQLQELRRAIYSARPQRRSSQH